MWWLVALAGAQDPESGFDAHGFRFATADGNLRAPVQFVRPSDLVAPAWSIGAVAEYASRPLVFELDGVRTPEIRNLVATDLTGGIVPWDRVRIDVTLPVYLSTTHPDGPRGPTPGDLHSSVLVTALRPEDAGGFGLGLLAAHVAPTGDPARFLGDTGFAGLLALSSTTELEQVTFSWMAGGRFAANTRPDERPAPTRGGDTVEAAGSLGTLIGEDVGVGLEAWVSLAIDPAVRGAIGVPAGALASGRYRLDGGGWVSAALGTGLGAGAGASPLRLVVGGGFGRVQSDEVVVVDSDGDRLDDPDDPCPQEAENLNGFRDGDGCPDVLPRLRFETRRGEVHEPLAELTVTGPDGRARDSRGQVDLEGLPGEVYAAVARIGSCSGAIASGEIPAEGEALVVMQIGRVDAELEIGVTDGAGRPLAGAEVRYLIADEACAPAETALVGGKGVHRVGAGEVTVFLTAPGYGVFQSTFTLAPGEKRKLEPKLAPTQVSLKDGELRLARPIQFGEGSELAGSSDVLLGQVASILAGTEARCEVWAWSPPGAAASLAQERAQVLVDALIALGVPPERLVAVGKGTSAKGQKEVAAFVFLGG